MRRAANEGAFSAVRPCPDGRARLSLTRSIRRATAGETAQTKLASSTATHSGYKARTSVSRTSTRRSRSRGFVAATLRFARLISQRSFARAAQLAWLDDQVFRLRHHQ